MNVLSSSLTIILKSGRPSGCKFQHFFISLWCLQIKWKKNNRLFQNCFFFYYSDYANIRLWMKFCYLYWRWISNYWNPLVVLTLPHFVSLPNQDRDFHCHMLWSLYMFNDSMWEVVVLYIGGFIDNHCVNFLFIIKLLVM